MGMSQTWSWQLPSSRVTTTSASCWQLERSDCGKLSSSASGNDGFFKRRRIFQTPTKLHRKLVKEHSLSIPCNICQQKSILSCVETAVFSVRLLHALAFSKKLPWLAQTKVITLKTRMYAVNACVKRPSQRRFSGSVRKYTNIMAVIVFATLPLPFLTNFVPPTLILPLLLRAWSLM